MPIVRPESLPMRYPLTAYDFEWRKRDDGTLHIYLCGAYDERGYRWYTTIAAFIAGELVAGNAGRRYYAHFGGASDMVFLLRELMKDRSLSIRGLFSSSSAIVVSVDRRALRWTFLDSFWTMRTSLAKVGTWLGLPKLEYDHSGAREHTAAEERDYNERDCRILYDALGAFQATVNDRGGELRVTAASTALDLFQRRYLARPIRNHQLLDEYARPAYIASRVERFRESCETAKVWDINSSFPYSFTLGVPGDARSKGPRLPDSGLYIADCDVSVLEQYVPPLPVRGEDGRIYFPTGRFRTRLTNEDVLCGDFRIEKVHSSIAFEERDDMAGFAEDLYKLRASGGFASEVWKIVLNSLYGKFAERAEKQVLLVNPEHRPDPTKAVAIAPRIYLLTEDVEVSHSHVPISTIITARSRRLLRELALASTGERRSELYQTQDLGGAKLYYCDTDSSICDATFRERKQLGGLKLEAEIRDGTFLGSKLYAYRTDAREVVKAKGFSRIVSEGGERTALTYDDFTRLKDGEGATVERMRRIKELLREGGEDYTPDVVRMKKALRAPRPKRHPMPGGDSRPWTYEELTKPSP